jgi:hypothetical protein
MRHVMTHMKINESKDVAVYKMLLELFGNYSKSFPCTGVDNLFDSLVNNGKKVLPKDLRALAILEYFCNNNTATAVQKILNIRFADLPVELKPCTKNVNKHEVASWTRNDKISDRIKDLINFDMIAGQGYWSDIDGEKVTLIDAPISKI